MRKSFRKINLIIIISFLSILLIQSCAEDPFPTLPPNINSAPTPVISSIEPDEALAGVTQITINGSNFSSTIENNFVHFDGIKGTVLSASNTQLVVISPNVISDSVIVKIAVQQAEDFSNIIIYKLKPAISELYPFTDLIVPYGITTDAQENLYVSISGSGMKKIDINGVLTDYAPKGAETFFNSMKFGPNNIIYAARRVSGIIQVQENLPPAAFVSSANGIGNVVDLDFDQNDMIWAGGSGTSIYRVTPDKNVKAFSFGPSVNSVRIFENSLYVAGALNNEQIIWQIPIISQDSLGTAVEYFNVSGEIGPNITVNAITFSLDGDLIVGTNRTIDPIIIVNPDKIFETLYPGLISPNVYSLAWGNGNFLYYSKEIVGTETQTVFKINMQKPGAPYYGRD